MKRGVVYLGMCVCILSIIDLTSCEPNESGCGKHKVSQTGDHESHNNGANCMSCHSSGGDGEGCFTVAGSVYQDQSTDPLANVTVKLYTEAQGAGQLRYTLHGDAKGNFYTTDDVAYSGLWAAVTGPSGNTRYMSSSLTSGSCNSCHGVTTDPLWAD